MAAVHRAWNPLASCSSKCTSEEEEETYRRCLQVLGLTAPPLHASAARQAFLSKAASCHPDKGGTEDQFVELTAAYQVVKRGFQRQLSPMVKGPCKGQRARQQAQAIPPYTQWGAQQVPNREALGTGAHGHAWAATLTPLTPNTRSPAPPLTLANRKQSHPKP